MEKAREFLKKIRQENNMTHEQTAKLLGISRVFYTNIENGKRNLRPDLAQTIATVLNFKKYGLTWTVFFEKSNTS